MATQSKFNKTITLFSSHTETVIIMNYLHKIPVEDRSCSEIAYLKVAPFALTVLGQHYSPLGMSNTLAQIYKTKGPTGVSTMGFNEICLHWFDFFAKQAA